MNNDYLNILLALAAIVAPLGLAGLLVELRSRQKSSLGKRREYSAPQKTANP